MTDNSLFMEVIPAQDKLPEESRTLSHFDTVKIVTRLCDGVDPAMGFGMCHYNPPGGCRCTGFVTPSAGDGKYCANCRHHFDLHW
jgi:hypothetical protein